MMLLSQINREVDSSNSETSSSEMEMNDEEFKDTSENENLSPVIVQPEQKTV